MYNFYRAYVEKENIYIYRVERASVLVKEEKERGISKWWDCAVNSAWCPPNAPSELLPRCGTASCK